MRRVHLALGVLLITTRSIAQTETPRPTPTPGPAPYNITLRFHTWPVKGILHGGVDVPALPKAYVQSADGYQRVPLVRSGMSPPVVYRGMEPPALVQAERVEAETPDAPPHYRTRVLASPDIPRDWRQAVVILFPESKRPDGTWSTLPIPASRLDLPEGAGRFLNTTKGSVILEVDGDRFPIQPGASRQLPSVGENKRVRVRLYARDDKGRTRLLYTASQWNRKERGNLYVIYPDGPSRFQVLQMSAEDLTPPTPTPEP